MPKKKQKKAARATSLADQATMVVTLYGGSYERTAIALQSGLVMPGMLRCASSLGVVTTNTEISTDF